MISIYAIVLTWLVNMPTWLQIVITIILGTDILVKVVKAVD